MSDTDPIDRALAEIEAAARAKRASGEITADLESELDAEFRAVVGTPPEPLKEIARFISELRALNFDPPDPASTSTLPGGQLMHRVVSTTVRRHNQEQAEQLRALRDSVADALTALERRVTDALDDLERRHRRTVSDVRAELADLWRLVGSRDGAA